MMGADGFANKMEATVGRRTCQGAVKVGELTRTKFAVGAGRIFMVVPVESL